MPDDLDLLTGPGAADVLAAALATVGQELLGWRVRSVDHRPGRGTTAAYTARVRGRDGASDQVLGASTGLPTPDAVGLLRLSVGTQEVAVWRFPCDPGLPALRTALGEGAVRDLLDGCGVEPGPVELRVRSYRPGRRAVVEVRTPTARLFLKVLPPHAVEAVHGRHVLLRDAGLPVPRSLGWSAPGLLVLEALSGTPLRRRLREGGAPDVDATALLELLGRLPVGLCALPRRPSWSDEVEHYAAVTAAALPAEAERCAQLAAAVRAGCTAGAGVDPVHGDLYETSLLLSGGRITGLLDVDTAGPGRRADDLACVLAHLSVLARSAPAHGGAAHALAERWRHDVERTVDPADLRARVAGVVVSLATGPHRAQAEGWRVMTRDRLDLAQDWLDLAAASDGSRAPGRTTDRR